MYPRTPTARMPVSARPYRPSTRIPSKHPRHRTPAEAVPVRKENRRHGRLVKKAGRLAVTDLLEIAAMRGVAATPPEGYVPPTPEDKRKKRNKASSTPETAEKGAAAAAEDAGGDEAAAGGCDEDGLPGSGGASGSGGPIGTPASPIRED